MLGLAPATGGHLRAAGGGMVDFGIGHREANLGWRLGARPGLTRFPAPGAPGRDSCPPECQGQGGA